MSTASRDFLAQIQAERATIGQWQSCVGVRTPFAAKAMIETMKKELAELKRELSNAEARAADAEALARGLAR